MSIKSVLPSGDGFSWSSWASTPPLCAVDFNYAALICVSGRRGWEGLAGTVLLSFQRAGNLLAATRSTRVKLAGAELKREGLQLQPVDPLWFLVRQMQLVQNQGSGDRGWLPLRGQGTGCGPWVSAGPAGGMQAGGPSLNPPSADRCRGWGTFAPRPPRSCPL